MMSNDIYGSHCISIRQCYFRRWFASIFLGVLFDPTIPRLLSREAYTQTAWMRMFTVALSIIQRHANILDVQTQNNDFFLNPQLGLLCSNYKEWVRPICIKMKIFPRYYSLYHCLPTVILRTFDREYRKRCQKEEVVNNHFFSTVTF